MKDNILNQLDRVICQIRFQPILSVNSRIGEFQEKIIKKYPVSAIKKSVQLVNMDVHDFSFSTEDNKWAVTVSMNSLSLTTTSYTTWEDFLDRFEFVFKMFLECFNLNYVVRIGLRYINAIRPSRIGCSTIDSLIVERYRTFTHSDLGEILNSNTLMEIRIDDDTICRSSFGLIHFTDDNEVGFMIDNDVISVKKTILVPEVEELLNKYNQISLDIYLKMTSKIIHKEVK